MTAKYEVELKNSRVVTKLPMTTPTRKDKNITKEMTVMSREMKQNKLEMPERQGRLVKEKKEEERGVGAGCSGEGHAQEAAAEETERLKGKAENKDGREVVENSPKVKFPTEAKAKEERKGHSSQDKSKTKKM